MITLYGGVTGFPLIAIPLFVLAGRAVLPVAELFFR
jgi:TRAP-type C4-dicarboxylate transport system permease large subunit